MDDDYLPLGNEEDGGDVPATSVTGPVPTVIYVGHLPHGFYEEQLGNFFGQFGKIERVKVARSTRTAASKGYGWVRFADPTVCSIAAKAMNNYMLFKKKIVVSIVPVDAVPPQLFKNTYRKMLPSRRADISKAAVNAVKDEDRTALLQKRLLAKKKRWTEMGIDYAFEAQPDGPAETAVVTSKKSKK